MRRSLSGLIRPLATLALTLSACSTSQDRVRNGDTLTMRGGNHAFVDNSHVDDVRDGVAKLLQERGIFISETDDGSGVMRTVMVAKPYGVEDLSRLFHAEFVLWLQQSVVDYLNGFDDTKDGVKKKRFDLDKFYRNPGGLPCVVVDGNLGSGERYTRTWPYMNNMVVHQFVNMCNLSVLTLLPDDQGSFGEITTTALMRSMALNGHACGPAFEVVAENFFPGSYEVHGGKSDLYYQDTTFQGEIRFGFVSVASGYYECRTLPNPI